MDYVDYHSNATHSLVAIVGGIFLWLLILPTAQKKKYRLAIRILVIAVYVVATAVYQKLADDNYPDFNHWIISIMIAWVPAFLIAFLMVALFPNNLQASANGQTRSQSSQVNTKGRNEGVKFKSCPFCAETIRAEAIKCRYCGSSMPETAKESSTINSSHGTSAHDYNSNGFCVRCGWERAFIENTGRSCNGATYEQTAPPPQPKPAPVPVLRIPSPVPTLSIPQAQKEAPSRPIPTVAFKPAKAPQIKAPNNWRAEKAKHKEKIQALRESRDKRG